MTDLNEDRTPFPTLGQRNNPPVPGTNLPDGQEPHPAV